MDGADGTGGPAPSVSAPVGRSAHGSAGDHGQDHAGGAVVLVEDGLAGGDPDRALPERLAGVEVAVEAGEVRRADLEADAVAGQEDVRRRPQVDREAVRPAWLQRDRVAGGVAVAGPDDPI